MSNKMSYDQDVKRLLGAKVYDKILNVVETAKVSVKDAQIFAFHLKPEVGGAFRHARDERNFVFDARAFKKILSDWYRLAEVEERLSLSDKIVEIFRHPDVGLNAVAVELEELVEEEARRPKGRDTERAREEKKRAWLEACRDNKVDELKLLVKEDRPRPKAKKFLNLAVTTFGTADSTPLAIAALNGRSEIVQLLLEEGASPSRWGW